MKHPIKQLSLVLLLLTAPMIVQVIQAQPELPPPPSVPIDGGISLFLIGAAGAGAWLLKKRKS